MILDMNQPAVAQDPDEATLRSWDWRAELRRQERSVPWLARQTKRAENTVYRYSWGHLPAPVDWLREAARVLGVDLSAA
jgi:hypothetical protein